jgi:raffinose/stachyose/melibiose transport system permease protein
MSPIAILIFNSLKNDSEIGTNALGVPLNPHFDNYITAFTQGDYGDALRNSTILALGTMLGVCLVAGMAAYAMCRMDLPGGSAVFTYLVAGTTIPSQLYLIPLYFLWSSLNLLDNLLGLIIIYIALFSPFQTLLLRSFMLSIPRDFDDAARLDGANEFQVFTRVVLPMIWPGLLTVALLSGLGAWNEFLFAILFMQTPANYPVSTALTNFQQGFAHQWGLIDAAAVITILPVIIVFLILQRKFIAGLTAGGLGK